MNTSKSQKRLEGSKPKCHYYCYSSLECRLALYLFHVLLVHLGVSHHQQCFPFTIRNQGTIWGESAEGWMPYIRKSLRLIPIIVCTLSHALLHCWMQTQRYPNCCQVWPQSTSRMTPKSSCMWSLSRAIFQGFCINASKISELVGDSPKSPEFCLGNPLQDKGSRVGSSRIRQRYMHSTSTAISKS